MKLYKTALKNLLVVILFAIVAISCDSDFANLQSDIINQDNATDFSTNSEKYDVLAYTKVLGPVQTNNLPMNFLGIYDDPLHGRTTASIVTQVNSSLIDPTFGNNVVIDSVVLTLPYFSTNTGINEDNEFEYRLDSIFPRNSDDDYKPISLSIYENNYFLRDFDPNASFDTPQTYFSDKSLSNMESINEMELEATPILIYNDNGIELNPSYIVTISDEQINLEDEEGEITSAIPPSIRIKLDEAYWKSKIFDQEGSSVLSNFNNFQNYFRGLYFKADALNNTGSFIGLNLSAQNANITIYYSAESTSDATVRNDATYTLTFGPSRVNFFENNFSITVDGDDINGDSRLHLKGGQGAVAEIKLFDGLNEFNEDRFEAFKNQFAKYDNDGDFEKSLRLVNEANLVFYVDQTAIAQTMNSVEEPNRIYLYDMDNNTPLLDYFIDFTSSSLPALSKPNHLGILQREDDEPNGAGIKYKIKITEHIKNLIRNDSTNVTLGLAISKNVNLEEGLLQRGVRTMTSEEMLVPISSILSPKSTVLHGSNSEIEAKRLYLEIFYTCLENCDEN